MFILVWRQACISPIRRLQSGKEAEFGHQSLALLFVTEANKAHGWPVAEGDVNFILLLLGEWSDSAAGSLSWKWFSPSAFYYPSEMQLWAGSSWPWEGRVHPGWVMSMCSPLRWRCGLQLLQCLASQPRSSGSCWPSESKGRKQAKHRCGGR